MRSYNTIRKYIFILPAPMLMIDLCVSVGIIPYIVLIIILLCLFIYASANINSGVYIKTLCSIKTKDKIVAVSFDDGPTSVTPLILDVLKEKQVKAVFFCVGKQIKENSGILKRIDQEGHLIGNHSYTHHLWFDLFPAKKIIKELTDVDEQIMKITGKKINLFRPPYGVTNPGIRKAVKIMNYITIGWSLRSKDTVIKDPERLMKRLKKNLRPGAVILFHDKNPDHIVVLKDFLNYLSLQGYQVIGLDELFNIKAYA